VSRLARKSTKPVTAVRIDGNTLQAAVVSLQPDGTPRVHALKTFEADALLERVSRISHPIFMDVDFLEFPDTPTLTRCLHELLDEEIFRNPLVGVFPSECVQEWKRVGPDQPDRRHQRLVRGLRNLQNSNPYSYPQVFGFDEFPAEPGMAEVNVWAARFDDVMVVAEQFLSLTYPETPFLGLVTGKRAISEALRLMAGDDPNRALTLIDVGKLRTIYAGHHRNRAAFIHAIPVGLLRDDLHYFRAIPIDTIRLLGLADEFGPLFLAPDMAMPPMPDAEAASPQIDCTRLGIQIARYATRVMETVWQEVAPGAKPSCCLSGLPTRLQGLHEFIAAKTHTDIARLGDSPIPGLHLEAGIESEAVANALVAIGAGVAYHRRDRTRYGMVLRDRRPIRLPPNTLERTPFQGGCVYVIEGPLARSARRNGGTDTTQSRSSSAVRAPSDFDR
jgi:hypothetical protein